MYVGKSNHNILFHLETILTVFKSHFSWKLTLEVLRRNKKFFFIFLLQFYDSNFETDIYSCIIVSLIAAPQYLPPLLDQCFAGS